MAGYLTGKQIGVQVDSYTKAEIDADLDAFVFDAGNNVGIGTTPSYRLDVLSPTNLISRFSGGANAYVDITNGTINARIQTSGAVRFGSSTNHVLALTTNNTERLRIDTAGNLLVGKTSTLNLSTTDGAVIGSSGYGYFTRSNSTPLHVARQSNDGNLIAFFKDGSLVGNVGTEGGDLTVGTGDVGLKFNDAVGLISPWDMSANTPEDSTIDLGYATGRFKNLYLSGGVYLGGTSSNNHLDDYEEGSWTPTMGGSTTAGSHSGATSGRYYKIGNVVTVIFRFSGVTVSGASGSLTIFGLPFAASTSGGAHGVTNDFVCYNIAFNSSYRQSLYNSGTTLIGLESRTATTWASWAVTNTAGIHMVGVATYDVA